MGKRRIKSIGIQGMCEYGQDQYGYIWYRWPGEPDSAWRIAST